MGTLPNENGHAASESGVGEPTIRQRIENESGVLPWSELARHFARGVVVVVSREIDLIDAAESVVTNELDRVQTWLNDGSLARASDDNARDWVEREPRFNCVVAAPWVLVKETSSG